MKATTVGELFEKAAYTGRFESNSLLYFFDENKKEIGYCLVSDSGSYPATACEISRNWSEIQKDDLRWTKIK
jgi:hypothetical protein